MTKKLEARKQEKADKAWRNLDAIGEQDFPRLPSRLRAIGSGRQIQKFTIMLDRPFYDLSQEHGHYAVFIPFNSITRMVKIQILSEQKADTRCDRQGINRYLKYSKLIALRHFHTICIKKRFRAAIGENIIGADFSPLLMESVKIIERAGHIRRLADDPQLELMPVALQFLVAGTKFLADTARKRFLEFRPGRRQIENIIRDLAG